MSDVAKADNVELQETTENAVRSTQDLTAELDNQTQHPLHDLLGLDKRHSGFAQCGNGEKVLAGRTHLEGKLQAHRNRVPPRIRLWHSRRHQE